MGVMPEPSSDMNHSIDETIDGLAAGQHGVVTRAQLLAAGLTPRMVWRRVRSKRLRPLHRGVYQAGPVMAARAREMAAVLACGPGSAVSYRSAGWLWDILAPPAAGEPVDVTVVGRDRSRRPGIRSHRVERLAPNEGTGIEGIPATTAGRTVVDLASVLDRQELERAVARAERREIVTREELSSLIERHRGRPGIPWLATLIRDLGGAALTRSEAEIRFLALVRSSGLPPPLVNVVVGGYEVDFFWPSAGIAVEVDGFAFHSSRRRFESDHRRDTRLAGEGVQVIQITWRQIVDAPTRTMLDLGRALDRALERNERTNRA